MTANLNNFMTAETSHKSHNHITVGDVLDGPDPFSKSDNQRSS